jgi:antirestriction protein ArdC
MEHQRIDVHTRVTNAIIHAIEQGVTTCEMPWHRRAGSGLPYNPVTNKTYHGINTVSLWIDGQLGGYASPYWASYRQWQSLGAQVRSGEHGSLIVFYKVIGPDPAQDDVEETTAKRAVIRYSFVFNSEQVEGWSCPRAAPADVDIGTLSNVEEFVTSLRSRIRYGSDGASYSPVTDRILMPHRNDFRDTAAGNALEGFYAVLLHEHIHWSGHPSRLNRDLSGRFETNTYAMEELVAELGAAFLCASLGISTYPRTDHASYIANWLRVLKEQKTAIFAAASAASVASQFLETLSNQNRLSRTA